MNVLGNTKVLGVFGDPVEHSLSPLMHNAAFEALNIGYVYVPFHVLPGMLAEAVDGIRSLSIRGVNVTIPHKQHVILYLDEVSEYAMQISSVNTIINDGGRLRGETTDGVGFMRSAQAAWGKIDGCRVLMLGAGGAAKAVSYALAGAGCKITVANRTFERAVELARELNLVFGNDVSKAVGLKREVLAEEIKNVDLLVNTTSVGMYPNINDIPLPPDLLHDGLLVYDLIYNPMKTRLVSEAQTRGAKAITGLKMLVYQGAVSFELWTGLPAPVDVMEQALLEHFDRMLIKK